MKEPSVHKQNVAGTAGLATASVSQLEMSGVLISRMIHELTNQLTVIAGNLQLAEIAPDDPELQARALKSMRAASDALGESVERYASFRRTLRNEADEFFVDDLIAALGQCVSSRSLDVSAGLPDSIDMSKWEVITPESIPGRIQAELRWVLFAVQQTVALSRSPQGRIQVHPPGATFDPRGLRQITSATSHQHMLHLSVCWPSLNPTLKDQDLIKPPTLQLAVIIGLARWINGQVGYGYVDGENRFWFSLPIHQSAP